MELSRWVETEKCHLRSCSLTVAKGSQTLSTQAPTAHWSLLGRLQDAPVPWFMWELSATSVYSWSNVHLDYQHDDELDSNLRKLIVRLALINKILYLMNSGKLRMFEIFRCEGWLQIDRFWGSIFLSAVIYGSKRTTASSRQEFENFFDGIGFVAAIYFFDPSSLCPVDWGCPLLHSMDWFGYTVEARLRCVWHMNLCLAINFWRARICAKHKWSTVFWKTIGKRLRFYSALQWSSVWVTCPYGLPFWSWKRSLLSTA